MVDLKHGSFVWDSATRRMLLVDLNACVRGPQGRVIAITDGWSAPEACAEPYQADVRCDVFSLGRVFAELAVCVVLLIVGAVPCSLTCWGR